MTNELNEIARSKVNRRAFLARMSAAGLGAAATALLAGCGGGGGDVLGQGDNPPSPVLGDTTNFPGIPGRNIDETVLNFALTLEILEADLYRQALNLATGRPLITPLDPAVPAPGSTGAYVRTVPTGSIAPALVGPAFLYLVQYAYVEAAHRDFLRTVLGAQGVEPNAAGYQFGPLAPASNLASILTSLLAVEETGVRAYLGAAGFITNLSTTTTAVAIYSTEARHSAGLAYVLGIDPGPRPNAAGAPDQRVTPTYPSPNTFEYFLAPPTVINAVQPFIVK